MKEKKSPDARKRNSEEVAIIDWKNNVLFFLTNGSDKFRKFERTHALVNLLQILKGKKKKGG